MLLAHLEETHYDRGGAQDRDTNDSYGRSETASSQPRRGDLSTGRQAGTLIVMLYFSYIIGLLILHLTMYRFNFHNVYSISSINPLPLWRFSIST